MSPPPGAHVVAIGL